MQECSSSTESCHEKKNSQITSADLVLNIPFLEEIFVTHTNILPIISISDVLEIYCILKSSPLWHYVVCCSVKQRVIFSFILQTFLDGSQLSSVIRSLYSLLTFPPYQVSSWVTQLIVTQATHEDRKAVLSCILRLAVYCCALGNFNSAVEILCGLRWARSLFKVF